MSLEKVLVALDGSEMSAGILPVVERLIAGRPVEVTAVRVLDGYELDDKLLRGEDAVTPVREQLDRALEPLRKAGARTRTEVHVGDAAARILGAADEIRPSLLALATHGRTGLTRLVRGSTAERVLRNAHCPVLVANPRAFGSSGVPRRIFVPLDGSEESAAVLPLALELARRVGAELVLLHSATDRAEGEQLLARFAERLETDHVTSRVVYGAPAAAILDATGEGDLVAMTTHGRSGPSRWIFGSVAENVVRACRAPLLIVRPGQS